MTARILIVHFTPPGVIGGVEHIIEQHVRVLSKRGYEFDLVAGRSTGTDRSVHVIPEVEVARPESERLDDSLASGAVDPIFYADRRRIREALLPLAARADLLVVHNAFTLHFCMPLTSVLWELGAARAPGSTIAWCHDLSWTNPLYLPRMHPGYPWDLLRRPAPNVRYVTVSEERRVELCGLWGTGEDRVTVVPNGVDPEKFLRLTPEASTIAETFRLFDREMVLLLPVRITRRKNIELAIRVVAALRDRGIDVLFMVSGPQAPHHPGLSDAYLARLETLRDDLGVRDRVIFLAEALGSNASEELVSELYLLADALLFPSAQEGFGLPILEAGLARTPVITSDIPIFREVGGKETVTFELDDPPDRIADVIIESLDTASARLYRRVLREYRWDSVVSRHILPLFHGRSAD